MKYGMRRKIDDDRRRMLVLWCVGLVAVAAAGWFGYGAWMHPYEVRRERLGGVIREAESLLARFDESLSAADRSGLDGARNRMAELSAEAGRRVEPLPEFSLDPELYVVADRMTAERLLEAHAATVAEYDKARAALRSGAAEASDLVEAIDGFLDGADDGNAKGAQSDLAQSLLELKAVHAQSRPSPAAADSAERRFNAAQRTASEVRARLSRRTAAAQQARADAESLAAEIADAEQRAKAAAERSRVLRAEGLSLQIDRNSAKLTTLEDSLRKGEGDVATALDAYRAAKRAADGALGDIQKQARGKCQLARDTIQRLVTEHGSFLPEEKVKVGVNALEELESAIREHGETWKKLDEQGRELVRQAETLRSEAGGLIVQLENARQKGQMGVDGVRASTLSGDLAAVRGKLASAETALGTEAIARRLDGIATHATDALKAVQAAKPDVPKLLSEIRKSAENIVEGVRRAQSEKERLESLVRDGRGESKSALEKALADCRYPDGAVAELRKLAAEDAATGRGILTLNARLAKAREAGQAFAAAVGKAGRDQKAAEAAGRFFPVSWEDGAIGWEVGKAGTITNPGESVLVPVCSGTPGKSYTWEFDLPFAATGQHRIEVKVAKANTSPVNESIERLKKAVHEGQSVNGGWIGVGCRLEASEETWYDELWIPNYNKLSPSETVVAANGTFGAGYQTFTLNLHLAASPATANLGGWHPERLSFTVFVDGKQVQRFWHKAR